MPSQKSKIRTELVAKFITDLAINVYDTRVRKIEPIDLPCVSVYTLSEQIDKFTQNLDSEYRLELTVEITAKGATGGVIQAALDILENAVIASVYDYQNSVTNQDLFEVQIKSTSSDYQDERSPVMGRTIINFEFKYSEADAADPDVLPDNLTLLTAAAVTQPDDKTIGVQQTL